MLSNFVNAGRLALNTLGYKTYHMSPPQSMCRHQKVLGGPNLSAPKSRDSLRLRRRFLPLSLRDGETTIKIKFSLLRGGGLGGREEKCPKTLVFVGNATTIKF